MSPTRRAFSILELLVVIAIIAILLALVGTALSGGKERGRRAACVNNLRQFNLGLHLYAGDQEEWLPAGYSDAGEGTILSYGVYWTPLIEIDEHIAMVARSVRSNLLTAMGGNEKVLNCPNMGKPFTNPGGYYYGGYGVVLGYNYLGGHLGTPWERTDFISEQWVSPRKITDDPQLVVLTDLNEWSLAEQMCLVSHSPNGSKTKVSEGSLGDNPRNSFDPIRLGAAGGNVAWLNGSVRWKAISKMKFYRGSRLYGDDGALALW
jgi:prepilin-type N-terminal cleavage/methylation domain-containing protein